MRARAGLRYPISNIHNQTFFAEVYKSRTSQWYFHTEHRKEKNLRLTEIDVEIVIDIFSNAKMRKKQSC